LKGEVGAVDLNINAVEMVRAIRDAHYEKIKDMSRDEMIAFFREEARALHAELGLPETFQSTPAQEAEERL
jgi:hypothetical protein